MMLAAFATTVFDSQRTFRELLQAMARPAAPRALPILPPSPASIAPAAMAVLLTLCDATTSVWLQQPQEDAVEHLRFHAGLRLAERPQDADFALITDPASMPSLTSFAHGDIRYPDRSASLIIQVAAFGSSPCVQGEVGRGSLALASTQDCTTPPQPSPVNKGGSSRAMHFAGPGIRETEILAIDRLPSDFWQQRAAMSVQLPLGVDLFFVAAQQVVALPRTTRLLES